MTDAGPSGTGSSAVMPEMLAAAKDQFQAGIQAIKARAPALAGVAIDGIIIVHEY